MENKVTAGVLQVLERSPQRLDVSPMKTTWDYLEIEKTKMNPTNLTKWLRHCGILAQYSCKSVSVVYRKHE